MSFLTEIVAVHIDLTSTICKIKKQTLTKMSPTMQGWARFTTIDVKEYILKPLSRLFNFPNYETLFVQAALCKYIQRNAVLLILNYFDKK